MRLAARHAAAASPSVSKSAGRAVDTARFVFRTYRTLDTMKRGRVSPREAGAQLASEATRMGPLYTKLAQFISARRDALDADFIDALSVVQDRVSPSPESSSSAPPSPPSLPGYVVEAEPIASASIADVYRGRRCSDGASIVVKRRRPGVKEQVVTDLPLLTTIMAVASFLRLPGAQNMYELVRESQPMVLTELDFRNEAGASRKFRQAFSAVPWLKIPRVLWASEEVLVMECVPSRKLADVRGPNPRLARRLMDMYMLMLEARLVHADPHPGNIGILEGGHIVLYDFGAVLEIDSNVGASMARMLQASMTKNPEGLMTSLEEIGVIQVRPGRRTSVRRVLRRALSGNVHEELGRAPEFVDPKDRVVTFGATFIYLARTLALIDAACRTLDPEFQYEYARWVDSSNAWLDTVRDVTAIPSTVLTMQSDMEEFQIRIMMELEESKRAATLLMAIAIPLAAYFFLR